MEERDPNVVHQVSGLLLCGGGSRRFGAEKGLALFRGRALAAWALSALDQISDDVWISTNRPEFYRSLGRPMVVDLLPGNGPLGGLHAGLSTVRHDLVAVAPCDMPHASPELFRYMLGIVDDFEVVVPAHEQPPSAPTSSHLAEPRYEPLHAIYSRACLSTVASALSRGERRLSRLYAHVKVRVVTEGEWRAVPGVHAEVFRNVNTPEELRQMEAEAGGKP